MELERDPALIERYLIDESSYQGHAEAVVRLHDLASVVEALKAAHAAGTPVTFSARRTSLTGAAIPEGGWVLALPEDSSPELVQVSGDRAVAPARVLIADVEAAAEAAGRFFGPDPTSRKDCSIGGSVACNASGARSFAHGPVGAWVEGLTVVLADGTVLDLTRGENPPQDGAFTVRTAGGTVRVPSPPPRRTDLKNSLGYALFEPPDLIDLFIGSEGTLGYIHDVTLRLLPAQPIFAALVFWDDLDAALTFVEQLQQGHPGLEPMSVEWFDARSLALAAERHPRFGVPKDAVAALFVEQRHAAEAEEETMMAWYEALLEAGAPDDESALRMPRTKADLDAFRDFRHAVPESINAMARSRGLRKLGTDLAYPAGWLKPMYHHYLEATAAAGLDAAMFGHIGDNHLHVNLLPRDAPEAEAGKALYAELARHCAEAGGAISGEHGIGKSKRAMYRATIDDETLDRMRQIKAALDPKGILAPGNIFRLA